MHRNGAAQMTFLAAALFVLPACESTPTTVENTSSKIKSVTYSGEGNDRTARIELKGDFGYDEASYLFMASREMLEILRKIATYFPDNQQQIDFILNARLKDQYGNSNEEVVVEVPFAMADVRKIKFANFTNWDLLNLSGRVRYVLPAGRDIVRSYCAKEDNRKYASRFCAEAL